MKNQNKTKEKSINKDRRKYYNFEGKNFQN